MMRRVSVSVSRAAAKAQRKELEEHKRRILRSNTEVVEFSDWKFRSDLLDSHRPFALAKKPRAKSMNDVTVQEIVSLRARVQEKRRSCGNRVTPTGAGAGPRGGAHLFEEVDDVDEESLVK